MLYQITKSVIYSQYCISLLQCLCMFCRSTPNLIPDESVRHRTAAVGQASPLVARRVQSASSIQKTAVKDKEKRYSAIFSTLR